MYTEPTCLQTELRRNSPQNDTDCDLATAFLAPLCPTYIHMRCEPVLTVDDNEGKGDHAFFFGGEGHISFMQLLFLALHSGITSGWTLLTIFGTGDQSK